MSGIKLLIDTNIALYLLGGDQIVASMLEQREIYISSISEMELLGFPGISIQEQESIRNFLSDCILIDMNTDIKERAIDIRQHYNLKLPDAIIAATALHLNLALISADNIFSRIEQLNFVHYDVSQM